MFIGNYEPKLDDKGRVILPSKFRERLEHGLVITKGQDYCLYVFARDEFEKMFSQIQSAPLTSKQARDYIRILLSGASDETPDKQGRFTIPPKLREYAGLKKQLTVLGTGNRIEIWDNERWQEYLRTNEESYSKTAQEIIPGVF